MISAAIWALPLVFVISFLLLSPARAENLSFLLIGLIIDGTVKTVLEWIEGFSLIGILLWLLYQTAKSMEKFQ
jgi:hypothetical protein